MSIYKVARLGHPLIRRAASPLSDEELKSQAVQDFIDSMIRTMREYDGVGLAAPQVHEAKQIAVMEVKDNPRYPHEEDVPLTVMINPRLTFLSDKRLEGWEGCLSIPDLRGKVERSESVVCEAWDREGKACRFEARGFFARVVQHEFDHLQGRVFLDRMTDLSSLTHLAEFSRYWI